MLSSVSVRSVYTVSEVAHVLRALEGRFALTPRGIRYFARTGMVVATGGRLKRSKTARTTRLYTVVDVALLRLVCRLHRQRVHERALWGLLVYRGAELRQLLERGEGTLTIETPAALAIGSEDPTTPKPIRIDARALLAGLTERLIAYRHRNPDVWTGLAWIPATVAAQEARR
jgi:hypothetical protein